MPIYEYKCSECDSHFEKMQKVSEEVLKICEKCGGKLEKQWSLSGFQFKGEGWYVTDYAGKKEKGKEEGAEKSEKSEKTENTSASDSTEKPKTASNEKSDSFSSSKKESVSKKE